VSVAPDAPERDRRSSSPWLKVVFTALVGASGIVAAGPGPQLVSARAVTWGLAGPVLGVAVVLLSIAVTASRPVGAVVGSFRLLLRWRQLPSTSEPFSWTLLVALAEEGVFRLAAFTVLPPTWWAVGAVSAVFTLVHVPRIARRGRPVRVAAASFMFSVALCVVFLWSASFWVVVTAHLVHNLALNGLRGALALKGKAAADKVAASEPSDEEERR